MSQAAEKSSPKEMEKIVARCKRRGFLFQSSEIYGGINGFWDYGPLGVELKRNVKEAWWQDMVVRHDDLNQLPGAPAAYSMTGLDCTIIMHPQVWKCSGHYDLFHDYMVDCRESKKRYRHDQINGRWVTAKGQRIFVTAQAGETQQEDMERQALKFFNLRAKNKEDLAWEGPAICLSEIDSTEQVLAPDAKTLNTLTEPREFNLMFKTTVGALADPEKDAAFLRPETAQGIFVNFKNVCDSTRVRVPLVSRKSARAFATRSRRGTSHSARESLNRWRSSSSVTRSRPRTGIAIGAIAA